MIILKAKEYNFLLILENTFILQNFAAPLKCEMEIFFIQKTIDNYLQILALQQKVCSTICNINQSKFL